MEAALNNIPPPPQNLTSAASVGLRAGLLQRGRGGGGGGGGGWMEGKGK